jgi:quinohemoprotein ethanol dehydrogenase
MSARYFTILCLSFATLACSSPDPEVASEPEIDEPTGTVVDDAALADETQGDNWLGFGRTYSEQRFSPLDQINAGNVANLRVDWFLDLPDDRGLISPPLVVDGTLYFVGSMNRVRAVDAVTGELLWEFDPHVSDNDGNGLRAGWEHSRGISFWNGKLYGATWDGRLNAIDAATGELVWSVRTFEPDAPLYITGETKVFKGKVLIGNGGTENGPNRGYVTAYDAETGEQAWRFWIVPGNPADGFENEAMAMAAETWTGEWWRFGGGGNAWHGFTYDPELDQLYIGTGNGAPWNRKVRSPGGGDNLFLSSIVALDPDTGEYLWHYQTTPGDTWDYTSTMDIVLADLEIGDRTVKALMHAPKNGFFYVIDRETGQLISGDPFVETTWATHIDLETGRPVEIPGARYEDGSQRITPSAWGAHSWHAMSYNPETGLAYIPTIHLSIEFSDEGIDLASWESVSFFGDTLAVAPAIVEEPNGVLSTLQAWDPVAKRARWEIPLPGMWNAGTMTTAGNLLFQGRVTGDFVAYDAGTGDELWSFDLGLGISAPPITYAVDGKQYVALLVGWGGGASGIGSNTQVQHGWAYGVHTRRLVAFSLEGSAELPVQPAPIVPQPIALDFEVDEALAARGEIEYGRCNACHGPGAISSGMAPDLRASPLLVSDLAFEEVVRLGSRQQNGMPQYAEITDAELLSIRHYVRQQAHLALE